jgi:flagellar biosynthesis protein FlhG
MQRPSQASPAGARVVAVTSGTGGAGKTFLSCNLAAALAAQHRRVLVLDAELGLASLAFFLRLRPKATLRDLLARRALLDDAIMDAPGGFSVVTAGIGLVEETQGHPQAKEALLQVIALASLSHDCIVIDTGAGVSDVLLSALSLADEVIVVATRDSLTADYASIKMLAARRHRFIHLVVNRAELSHEERGIHRQLQQAVDRFVTTDDGGAVTLNLLGEIPRDPAASDAARQGVPLLHALPGCAAARAVARVAQRWLSVRPG